MTSTPKPASPSRSEPARAFYRVAIVGAASLKGKEVAEVLEQRNFPSVDIKLLDDDETLGQLEAIKDEITFIQSLRGEQFEGVDFTFFASDAECTRDNWKQVQSLGSAIVDLSYALEDAPQATLRAPWVERQIGQVTTPELQPGPAVVAHPVSIVLALLMLRAQSAAAVRQATAAVFEPASEHGQKGMDELHQQTVNLLSFQTLPKQMFDVQIAFNMVPRYGEKAQASLASVTERILKHFGRIAAGQVPLPSVFALQAPVFHSHALAVRLQFGQPADLAQITTALAGDHVTIVPSPDEAPNNVNAAGQPDILVSVMPDAADADAVWLWAAYDNLRVAAVTAVECAETMAASRPRGQIQ